MDPLTNPFSPGAGAPPHELVGREGVLDQARILLGRTLAQRPEKSFLMTGLRGVGKTVLLNEMDRAAQASGYRTLPLEAQEDKSLAGLLAPPLRRLLFDLDRMAGVGNKARQALAVLKGFVGAVRVTVGDIQVGLDIDPLRGVADSGDLESDLPELFATVAEAAQDRGAGVALLIDEVQYLKKTELSALIMAMHRIQQRRLPFVLVGAGLPTLPALAGDSKSYAERLFNYPPIGPLSDEDAARALSGPVAAAGARIEADAVRHIVALTRGYPYFLQEWGYQAWNHAESSPITLQAVLEATPVVVRRLDENFFRVRFDRCTPSEKRFLRAMAEPDSRPCRTGDVAELLGMRVQSIGPSRATLMSKGMIYSPQHGHLDFTVPLFDEFMKRAIPTFSPGRSAP